MGLFIVVYTLVVFMSCCRNCVMYVRQLSLLQLLIWASYRHFKERLPEAICCCLQTCNVDVVFLVRPHLSRPHPKIKRLASKAE